MDIRGYGMKPAPPPMSNNVLPGMRNRAPPPPKKPQSTAEKPLPDIFYYDFDDPKQEKKWLNPKEDITDYFNYGMNEATWRMYTTKVKQLTVSAPGNFKNENSHECFQLDETLPIEFGGFGNPYFEEVNKMGLFKIMKTNKDRFYLQHLAEPESLGAQIANSVYSNEQAERNEKTIKECYTKLTPHFFKPKPKEKTLLEANLELPSGSMRRGNKLTDALLGMPPGIKPKTQPSSMSGIIPPPPSKPPQQPSSAAGRSIPQAPSSAMPRKPTNPMAIAILMNKRRRNSNTLSGLNNLNPLGGNFGPMNNMKNLNKMGTMNSRNTSNQKTSNSRSAMPNWGGGKTNILDPITRLTNLKNSMTGGIQPPPPPPSTMGHKIAKPNQEAVTGTNRIGLNNGIGSNLKSVVLDPIKKNITGDPIVNDSAQANKSFRIDSQAQGKPGKSELMTEKVSKDKLERTNAGSFGLRIPQPPPPPKKRLSEKTFREKKTVDQPEPPTKQPKPKKSSHAEKKAKKRRMSVDKKGMAIEGPIPEKQKPPKKKREKTRFNRRREMPKEMIPIVDRVEIKPKKKRGNVSPIQPRRKSWSNEKQLIQKISEPASRISEKKEKTLLGKRKKTKQRDSSQIVEEPAQKKKKKSKKHKKESKREKKESLLMAIEKSSKKDESKKKKKKKDKKEKKDKEKRQKEHKPQEPQRDRVEKVERVETRVKVKEEVEKPKKERNSRRRERESQMGGSFGNNKLKLEKKNSRDIRQRIQVKKKGNNPARSRVDMNGQSNWGLRYINNTLKKK